MHCFPSLNVLAKLCLDENLSEKCLDLEVKTGFRFPSLNLSEAEIFKLRLNKYFSSAQTMFCLHSV
jgi:hypothetical protein